jgi:hypothetical protein
LRLFDDWNFDISEWHSHLKKHKPVVEPSLDDIIKTSVEVRKNALKKQGMFKLDERASDRLRCSDVDLTAIARTSVAVSHSE